MIGRYSRQKYNFNAIIYLKYEGESERDILPEEHEDGAEGEDQG